MILSTEDARLFIKLMSGVNFHLNQKTRTFRGLASPDDYSSLPAMKKVKLRELLWKSPDQVDDFIQANPFGFSELELEILRGWRRLFVHGAFYIFRHLKKGTIFIGPNNHVYSVVGVTIPFDEIVPDFTLPRLVETVLLPFKGMVVYDGLLSGYDIRLGRNIRAEINHVYQVARHKDRIISSLEPDPEPASRGVKPPSRVSLPRLLELASALGAIKGDTPTQNAALSLAHASLDLAVAEAQGEDLDRSLRKVRRASTRLENLLELEAEE